MLSQRVKKTLSFQIIYSYTSSDSELFRMFSLFEYQQLQETSSASIYSDTATVLLQLVHARKTSLSRPTRLFNCLYWVFTFTFKD